MTSIIDAWPKNSAANWSSGQLTEVTRLQLRAVLRSYQESVFVVSNRLHSVIFGMIAGGTPLALASASDTKIRRTLAVVGLKHRVAEVTAPIPSQLLEPLDLTELLTHARDRLEVVRNRIAVPAELPNKKSTRSGG